MRTILLGLLTALVAVSFTAPAEAQLFPRLWRNSTVCNGPDCQSNFNVGRSANFDTQNQFLARNSYTPPVPSVTVGNVAWPTEVVWESGHLNGAALGVGDPGGTVYYQTGSTNGWATSPATGCCSVCRSKFNSAVSVARTRPLLLPHLLNGRRPIRKVIDLIRARRERRGQMFQF